MGYFLLGLTIAVLGVVGFWLWCERGRFLLPSTRELIRQFGGVREFFGIRGFHLYAYGRWPTQYIGLAVRHVFHRLGPRGKRSVADHYHGKVLTLQHARSIISVNRPICVGDLEQVVPFPTARRLLLSAPPEIAVFDCPCRRSRASPCRPIDVCLVFGQPFVDFVLQHHPSLSRRLTQAEALEVLEAEHRRGHVHAAWFKDVCLDRFFAICNCCKCCCGGIEAMTRYGIGMMTSSGYVAQVDASRCRGCGHCQEVCPFRAVHVDGRAEVAWQTCLGCGVCAGQCPEQAISLVRDPRKGVPLDVRLPAPAQPPAGVEAR